MGLNYRQTTQALKILSIKDAATKSLKLLITINLATSSFLMLNILKKRTRPGQLSGISWSHYIENTPAMNFWKKARN